MASVRKSSVPLKKMIVRVLQMVQMKPFSYYPIRGEAEGRITNLQENIAQNKNLTTLRWGNDGHDIFRGTLAIWGHICRGCEVHYHLFCHKDNSASCQIDWIGYDFKYHSQSLSVSHTHTHTKLLQARSVSDRDDSYAAGIILKQSGVRRTVFFLNARVHNKI